jgi:hypothetical protein
LKSKTNSEIKDMSKILAISPILVGATFLTGGLAQAVTYNQNITPGVIFGSGNANGSFTVDQSNGIELGLRGKLRHNASGAPENTFNSNGDGTYSFAAGVAPTQSFPTAVWSFEWSINSDLTTTDGMGGVLSAYTYLLEIDNDASLGTNFFSFDPINAANPSTVGGYWDHSMGDNSTTSATDLKATDAATYAALINSKNVAQNSWKAHWYMGAPFDPTVDGTYDIKLSAFSPNGGPAVASTKIQIIVGKGGSAVPDGGSMVALLGGSLLGLAGFRRFVTKRA